MDTAIATEFDRLGALIRASEEWSDQYKKDPDTFGRLLKAEAKLERTLLEYFKGLANDRIDNYVNWQAYNIRMQQIHAANEDDFQVDVIVTGDLDYENDLAMQSLYDPIASAVGIGFEAAEILYSVPLGVPESARAIEVAAKEQIANLVGKQVDKNGNIVDNPKAKYRISQTTRQQIRDSVRLSLSLGEDQEAARTRLQRTIKDPKRAAKIASTEAVNAYQAGMYNYAVSSGAVGKEWQAIKGACRICMGNVAVGIIPLKESFPSGHQKPSAHPYDRCGLRYVYAEELNT